jgi:enoyl-CoA hydratase
MPPPPPTTPTGPGPTGSAGVVAERAGPGVVRVTLGAGRRGNALATGDWEALERLFRSLAGDGEVRAVLLAGRGGTFSAGSDLREWVTAEPADVAAGFTRIEAALVAVEELPVPVVAAVDGVAAGAGCQLALACDLRLLAGTASLGMPVARLGVLVSPDFAARISRLSSPGVARDLLYTGRLVGAAEAVRFGLATRSVPPAGLPAAAGTLAATIAAQPPAAIRAAKRAVTAPGCGSPGQHPPRQSTPGVAPAEFRAAATAFLARGASPGRTDPRRAEGAGRGDRAGSAGGVERVEGSGEGGQ